MQDGIILIQARRCKRCGRLLTSKEAVERGYGCQCAEKARKEEFQGWIRGMFRLLQSYTHHKTCILGDRKPCKRIVEEMAWRTGLHIFALAVRTPIPEVNSSLGGGSISQKKQCSRNQRV